MANLYGTIRGANINPASDAEIFYNYKEDRASSADNVFTSLDASYLQAATDDDGNILSGVYSLILPLGTFNRKGIYTILIRPKEIETTITDISVLEAYPEVKGVVLNTTSNSDLGNISDFSGYRIEYYDEDGNKTDTARLITSSNFCEPVKVTVTDAYPTSTRYRLTNSSSNSLVFCTVTPSSANSFNTNALPFIGNVGQTIHIINTKFSPVLMEIEMVENDADTLATMIGGDQIRDVDNATITTYDHSTKEITAQYDYFTVKNEFGTPLYEAKVKRDTIDNIDFDSVTE